MSRLQIISQSRNFRRFLIILTLTFLLSASGKNLLNAQSLDLPNERYGVSFGNSKNFTGLRINFRDKEVDEINGVNVTLWRAKENKDAEVKGISLGVVGPEAGRLTGIQLSGLSVAAHEELKGFSAALFGVGSGGDITGITLGGLGAGAGGDIKGFTFGLLGVGAGSDMTGITIGGLGAGAGGDIKGFTFGLLGVGASSDMTGIRIGGLGAGAGGDIKGFTFGLLGAAAGSDMTGVTIGGLGAGAGGDIKGFTFGLVGAGAGSDITGITVAGFGAGAGGDITGVTIALGTVRVKDGNSLTGFTASAYNRIRGDLNGVSFGIVNYAGELSGVQLGLINYVRDNPKRRRLLPLINWNFD